MEAQKRGKKVEIFVHETWNRMRSELFVRENKHQLSTFRSEAVILGKYANSERRRVEARG